MDNAFHLHHRAVQNYQLDSAFLAGDAAHIHTPVGAKAMNTGLQDVTNLAWKMALVLKYQASPTLLNTIKLSVIRWGKPWCIRPIEFLAGLLQKMC